MVMENIDDKIWQYGLLSEDEKKDLEAYIEKHEALEPLLAEVKALYRLLVDARVLTVDSIDRADSGVTGTDEAGNDEVAIAYYIAHESFAAVGAPAFMADGYDRLREQVQHNMKAREQYDAIKLRMEEVASYSDPVNQFEQLTGHRIDEMPLVDKRGLHFGRNDRPPIVREPSLRISKWSTVTGALLVVVVLMGIMLNTNRLERMAYMDPEAVLQVTPSTVRGSQDVSLSAIDMQRLEARQYQLREGVLAFLNAQQNWLNVYYTFEIDGLNQAEKVISALKQDLHEQPQAGDDWIFNETTFVLAKVYLAQERVTDARNVLMEIVGQEGGISEKAAALLERLQ